MPFVAPESTIVSATCASSSRTVPRSVGRLAARARSAGGNGRRPARTGWDTPGMRQIRQSRKLRNVRYDVRGPILVEAHRLEAEGHKILKLNIGNTAPFGFEAPESIVADMVHNLPDSQGYSDSKGIYSARTAVAQYYQSVGLVETTVDDVFIGNGVSELIGMVLQAFLDDGNEVLVPAPDYPLWTGAVSLCGGVPVHYRCDEDQRVEPRPGGHRVQDHRPDPGAGDHQPQQPDRRGLQQGDRRGAGRHRAAPPARGDGRRDLREDHLRRRRPPPRGEGLRRRRAVPDLQRALEGLPGVRLPRRLGDDQRPAVPRQRLPRGPHAAGQHADVPQRAGPARDPDRAGRLPVDHRADRARRPLPRAEPRRCASCSTRSRASRPSLPAGRCTASRGSTPRSTTSRTTSSS